MKDNRLGGVALILGAIFGIVTLTLHPAGGPHRATPAQIEALLLVAISVHALALISLPVSFAGALVLTRRIDSPLRLALLGLIVYGFGLAAVMAAATMSGLVMPALIRQIVADHSVSDQVHTFMRYTHSLNQAFAQVGAIAFSIAIFSWSLVALKTRTLPVALSIYGLLGSVAIVGAIIFGLLNLELLGFRVITLIQSVWFFIAGVVLWRTDRESKPLMHPISSGHPASI